jgi:alpha-amylase
MKEKEILRLQTKIEKIEAESDKIRAKLEKTTSEKKSSAKKPAAKKATAKKAEEKE